MNFADGAAGIVGRGQQAACLQYIQLDAIQEITFCEIRVQKLYGSCGVSGRGAETLDDMLFNSAADFVGGDGAGAASFGGDLGTSDMNLRLTLSRAMVLFGLVTAIGLGAVVFTGIYALSDPDDDLPPANAPAGASP